jgi:hypothetical protein
MKPTIALFTADPKCSVQSCNGIMRALDKHYNFKLFSKNEVEDSFLNGVDMIVVPGGFGDSDSFDTLLKHNFDMVVNYVRNNGRYLGICMGAYWAGSHYFNILDNIQVEQYIRQPDTDTRRPHAKAIGINWKGQPDKMFFYDGPTFVGDGECEIVSTYATGYPMAIIQNKIGLIGCHPESEKFWYDSYSWMKDKYHNGKHHKFLLEFVNELIGK